MQNINIRQNKQNKSLNLTNDFIKFNKIQENESSNALLHKNSLKI